jgi:hypothetical protein
VAIDLGTPHSIERVVLYPLDDSVGSVRAPARYQVEIWRENRWIRAPGQRRVPSAPEGHRANSITISPLRTSRVRIILEPQRGFSTGLTEAEVWAAPH